MAIDMSQYMDVFFEEGKEHLENLNRNLLQLEKDAGDFNSLNEIFRAAHTLKGMSSTMGFEDLADLTHHMENVLADLKEGLLKVDSHVVDTLFQCFDRMQLIIENLESTGSSNMDNQSLIRQLENIKSGEYETNTSASDGAGLDEGGDGSTHQESIIFNAYDVTVLKEAIRKGYKAYELKISVADDCLMKAVRVFMVFKALEEEGEVVKSIPSVQDLEEGKFEGFFNLLIITKESEQDLFDSINKISEVRLDNLAEISEAALDSGLQMESKPASKQYQTAKDETENRNAHKVRKTIRVDIERLDVLMNLVGELVMHKGCLEQISASNRIPQLNETIEQMDRISTDLQSVVMKVRMVPIENVFNRFPRMVRDLVKELDKEVDFIIEGKDTELDRTVIDEIGDPLVHILRNSIDHGIELPQERIKAGKPAQGRLLLRAKHEGNNVYIEVEDDGMGIDTDRVQQKGLEKGLITAAEAQQMSEEEICRLIFTPGFSTSTEVTDISGRGVGLDVVKTKIESLSGEVFIDTRKGRGTKFTIKLPLTLAIIQALMVSVKNEIYAIPLSSVDETTMIHKGDIKNIQNQEVTMLRGTVLPLFRLTELLEVPGDIESNEEMYVVVVRKGDHKIGLIVDTLIGQQEIVIKSLGRLLTGIPGLAGAIVAGDGNVRLILDIATLF